MTDLMKVDAAAGVTDKVLDLVHQAEKACGISHTLNGYGVFADPSLEHARIRDAITKLQHAGKLMAETKWPTPEDYGE